MAMKGGWKLLGGFGLVVLLSGVVLIVEQGRPGPIVLERDRVESDQQASVPSVEDQAIPNDPADTAEVSPPEERSPESISGTLPDREKKDLEESPSGAKAVSLADSIDRLVDFGFQKASRIAKDIDTVVLHSSYNNQGGDRYSVEKVISIWKSYGVAPHFLIDRKGNIYRLVMERDIAYHAGVSEMKDGRTNVNAFSIGVEILNAEDDAYTDAQYEAVKHLIAHLKKTYPIRYVVGHDDIASGRKTDPWNFDWKRIR